MVKKLNRNLIKEEDSSQCLKILSQYKEDENRLAEIRDVLLQRIRAIPSTNMIINIPVPDNLDKLLCHLQCLFQRPTK